MDNRANVLSHALRLFAARGYDAVGMQEIVEAAEHHGNMQGRHRAYATTFLGTIDAYIGLALSGEPELDEPTHGSGHLVDLLKPGQPFALHDGRVCSETVWPNWAQILQVT
jgi:hypothetical protein